MTKIKTVCVDKVAYEAVLRNYVRVNDLDAENKQLKKLLKECKHIMSIEKDFASCHFEKDKLCKLLTKINAIIGESEE